MKKIIITLIAVLLFSPCVFAKTGGPIENVGKGKFALSLEAEYIKEQRMRIDKVAAYTGAIIINESTQHSGDFKMSSGSYFLKLNYGLFDRLDVFFKMGMGKNVKNYNMFYTFNSLSYERDFNTDYSFAWAAGFNSKLFSVFDWFDVGFQAQFLRERPKEKTWHIMRLGSIGENVEIRDMDAKYYKWNAALYFYKPFKFVTPYIGAKYQYSQYRWKGDYDTVGGLYITTEVEQWIQDMPWILFGGFDFHINKRLDANIELSTFGSRSASFGLTWKF